MRKDEITKKHHAKKTKRRNNARQKDKITKSATRKDEKHARKDEKTPCEIMPFKTHIFRLFAQLASFRYFVFSLCAISSFRFLA